MHSARRRSSTTIIAGLLLISVGTAFPVASSSTAKDCTVAGHVIPKCDIPGYVKKFNVTLSGSAGETHGVNLTAIVGTPPPQNATKKPEFEDGAGNHTHEHNSTEHTGKDSDGGLFKTPDYNSEHNSTSHKTASTSAPGSSGTPAPKAVVGVGAGVGAGASVGTGAGAGARAGFGASGGVSVGQSNKHGRSITSMLSNLLSSWTSMANDLTSNSLPQLQAAVKVYAGTSNSTSSSASVSANTSTSLAKIQSLIDSIKQSMVNLSFAGAGTGLSASQKTSINSTLTSVMLQLNGTHVDVAHSQQQLVNLKTEISIIQGLLAKAQVSTKT